MVRVIDDSSALQINLIGREGMMAHHSYLASGMHR
jgi:hypothetical protein